ncbi:hypothetical protein K8Q98_00105 [Candidatus Nomurabacteria bacterium]|nr:hypothetical protein [Candidatus Nomurabacteria bacterium]
MYKSIYFLLLLNLIVFISTLFFSTQPLLLFIVYFIASVILLLIKRNDFMLFSIAVIFSVVFESIAVSYGVWSYPAVSNLLQVPAWIFLMWGVAAVSAYRLGLHLAHKRL